MKILTQGKSVTRTGTVMTKLFTFIFTAVFAACTWGHGGTEPLVELQKNDRLLTKEQTSFAALKSKRDQIDSLERQIGYLRTNIMVVQDLMAKEYPHVRENMSKYKLDYIDVLDESLKKFRLSLKQASQLVD